MERLNENFLSIEEIRQEVAKARALMEATGIEGYDLLADGALAKWGRTVQISESDFKWIPPEGVRLLYIGSNGDDEFILATDGVLAVTLRKWRSVNTGRVFLKDVHFTELPTYLRAQLEI